MDVEIEALESHRTWEPSTLPPGITSIDTRWVYKIKAEGHKKS